MSEPDMTLVREYERRAEQAEHLSPADAPEATIHGAYYAVLHAATALLLERTGPAPKTHSALIGQLSDPVKGDEQGRRLGRAFNLAEDLRVLADYDDRTIPTATEAAALRSTARDFLAYCRALL